MYGSTGDGMTAQNLDSGEDHAIADLIREAIARRRITRRYLADQAKISLSTLEKALSGQRPFTLASIVRLEAALGVTLRNPTPQKAAEEARFAGIAPAELGSYGRAAVSWIEGDYLTVRPSFSTREAVYAYRMTIYWKEERSHLMFKESERIDAAFTQAEPGVSLSAREVFDLRVSTPLANWLVPAEQIQQTHDTVEVERRALIQSLALRSWQLKHDGRYPEKLTDLVPDELDRLPADPYRNATEPFRYIRWREQSGNARDASRPAMSPFATSRKGRFGGPLLYSVGVNGRDDGGSQAFDGTAKSEDLVFPLPTERPRLLTKPGPTSEGDGNEDEAKP